MRRQNPLWEIKLGVAKWRVPSWYSLFILGWGCNWIFVVSLSQEIIPGSKNLRPPWKFNLELYLLATHIFKLNHGTNWDILDKVYFTTTLRKRNSYRFLIFKSKLELLITELVPGKTGARRQEFCHTLQTNPQSFHTSAMTMIPRSLVKRDSEDKQKCHPGSHCFHQTLCISKQCFFSRGSVYQNIFGSSDLWRIMMLSAKYAYCQKRFSGRNQWQPSPAKHQHRLLVPTSIPPHLILLGLML
jgi:hypothetical protein